MSLNQDDIWLKICKQISSFQTELHCYKLSQIFVARNSMIIMVQLMLTVLHIKK